LLISSHELIPPPKKKKPAIFQDIAQEALQLCHQSLVTASESIKARQEGGRSPGVYELDGALFLVRHLWVLKEVVVGYELGGGDSGGGGRVDVRERDESVKGELFVCRQVGLFYLLLLVLRYASQLLVAYVRFVTFT